MTNNSPTWKEISYANSGDRSFHTSTLFKHYVITFGGYSDSLEKIFGIKILNLSKCSYEDFLIEGDKPLYRIRHSACLLDSNKILIFGGYANNTLLNDTAIITIKETLPLTLSYKKMSTTGENVFLRCNHSADIYQNKMYIFGGRHSENPRVNNNELWSLDLENFDWKFCETTGDIPEARAAHCSAIFKDKLYIFGGYSDSQKTGIKSCGVLSFESMKWNNLEMQGMDFLTRYGASSVIFNNMLFILGGCYSNENQVLTFDFEENLLRSSDYQGDYQSVIGGTAVVYKDNLVLWGGLKNEEESISKISCLRFGETRLDCLFEGENYKFSNYTESLFGSEQYSDIRFLIEGQGIPAHKLVLSARCKYFANLFESTFFEKTNQILNSSGGMKESNSSIIQVKNIKLDTFKALLQFLYQNKIELTVPLALELYAVADKYMQTELVSICEKFLSKNIELENLMQIIEVAEKFGAGALKNSTLEFITKNFEALKENQTYYLLPYSYIWEIASRLRDQLQLNTQP